MPNIPVHVIDFEGSRQSGIVEYGVVTLDGGTITATQTRLCAAIGTISDRDRLQHGISESAVEGEALFQVDWEYFAGLREEGPLCAHNAAVEDGLLRSVWSYPRNSPDFSEPGQMCATWGPWLDTLYLYRRIYPQLESHKLADLVDIFGLSSRLKAEARLHCPPKRQQYHCALFDALASALLFARLYEEPELDGITLHWLLRNSAASESVRESMGQQRLL